MRRIKWRTVVVSLLSCFAILMLPTMVDELTRRQLAQLRKEYTGGPKLDVVDGNIKGGVFGLGGIWSWIAEKLVKEAG